MYVHLYIIYTVAAAQFKIDITVITCTIQSDLDM